METFPSFVHYPSSADIRSWEFIQHLLKVDWGWITVLRCYCWDLSWESFSECASAAKRRGCLSYRLSRNQGYICFYSILTSTAQKYLGGRSYGFGSDHLSPPSSSPGCRNWGRRHPLGSAGQGTIAEASGSPGRGAHPSSNRRWHKSWPRLTSWLICIFKLTCPCWSLYIFHVSILLYHRNQGCRTRFRPSPWDTGSGTSTFLQRVPGWRMFLIGIGRSRCRLIIIQKSVQVRCDSCLC